MSTCEEQPSVALTPIIHCLAMFFLKRWNITWRAFTNYQVPMYLSCAPALSRVILSTGLAVKPVLNMGPMNGPLAKNTSNVLDLYGLNRDRSHVRPLTIQRQEDAC